MLWGYKISDYFSNIKNMEDEFIHYNRESLIWITNQLFFSIVILFLLGYL